MSFQTIIAKFIESLNARKNEINVKLERNAESKILIGQDNLKVIAIQE
jgi:hypothetical protein